MFTVNVDAQHFNHANFHNMLQEYVADGQVDYKGLKDNRALLTEYLESLERVKVDEFQQWPEPEQLVFWINAYNAITLDGILQNYPIQWGELIARARFPQNSIRQISGFWDKDFVKVMGKDVTLNDIEHKILRKEFGDPRIHFAIVCATIGCPISESQGFFADDLAQRLDQAIRNFINDRDKVRLDRQQNILFLSSIFDWYKADFSLSADGGKKFDKYGKA